MAKKAVKNSFPEHNFHMLRRILKSLGTYVYHNKTMCRVHDPGPYIKVKVTVTGQGQMVKNCEKFVSGA